MKSCSEFPILIPLIALLSLILLAKNSAQIMKMYEKEDHPGDSLNLFGKKMTNDHFV